MKFIQANKQQITARAMVAPGLKVQTPIHFALYADLGNGEAVYAVSDDTAGDVMTVPTAQEFVGKLDELKPRRLWEQSDEKTPKDLKAVMDRFAKVVNPRVTEAVTEAAPVKGKK